jgi:hypothetical protein
LENYTTYLKFNSAKKALMRLALYDKYFWQTFDWSVEVLGQFGEVLKRLCMKIGYDFANL